MAARIISIVLSGYKQALCFSHDPAILKVDFLSGFPQRFTSNNKSFQEIPSRLNFLMLMLHSPSPSSSHSPSRGRNLSSGGQHPVSCLHPYLCAGWWCIYFSLHSRPIQRLRETHQWNVWPCQRTMLVVSPFRFRGTRLFKASLTEVSLLLIRKQSLIVGCQNTVNEGEEAKAASPFP